MAENTNSYTYAFWALLKKNCEKNYAVLGSGTLPEKFEVMNRDRTDCGVKEQEFTCSSM
jgi:hypothetical protein